MGRVLPAPVAGAPRGGGGGRGGGREGHRGACREDGKHIGKSRRPAAEGGMRVDYGRGKV